MFASLCSARVALCKSIRRHKKWVILGTVGTCAFAAYYGVKQVIRKAEAFSQDLHQQLTEYNALQIHLEKSREECEAAVLRFLPSLTSRINALLDMETAVNKLKSLTKTQRTERNAIWEEMKIICLTRLFVSGYAFSLLYLVVHVHLHIIGKQSYDLKKSGKLETLDKEHREAQHKFLACSIDYLLGEGLQSLVQHIQRIVQANSTVQEWCAHSKNPVNVNEFQNLILTIHQSATEDSDIKLWHSFIIFQDKDQPKDRSALNLLHESWDIIESPSFQDSLYETLNCVFQALGKEINSSVFKEDISPLARIIPKTTKVVGRLMDATNPHVYLKNLRTITTVKFLCETIFLQNESNEWPFV